MNVGPSERRSGNEDQRHSGLFVKKSHVLVGVSACLMISTCVLLRQLHKSIKALSVPQIYFEIVFDLAVLAEQR